MIEIIWSNVWISLVTSLSESHEEEGIVDQLVAQMLGWA